MTYLLAMVVITFVVGVGCLLIDSWRTHQKSLLIRAALELSDNNYEPQDEYEDLGLGDLSHQIL